MGPKDLTMTLTDRDRDLSASLQARFEDIYLAHVRRGVDLTGTLTNLASGASASASFTGSGTNLAGASSAGSPLSWPASA